MLAASAPEQHVDDGTRGHIARKGRNQRPQHAQQALTDYIDVINSEADKRTAQDDPLLAAVEKFKNKKRGKQHV